MGRGPAVTDELEQIRAQLALRREACFDRIDDAVGELIALHEVDGDTILAHVAQAIAAEQKP
jgi:hypothetical protein